MTDKKLTDYAITVRALKKILELMLLDGDLQRISTVSHAIDLINRQQAEIARLTDKAERAINAYFIKVEQRRNAKAEAVKEISSKAVLCKDCANAWTTICGKRYCSRLYAAVSDDDFCSLGTKIDKQKA